MPKIIQLRSESREGSGNLAKITQLLSRSTEWLENLPKIIGLTWKHREVRQLG